MEQGDFVLTNEKGDIVKKIKVLYWNASKDPDNPCLYVHFEEPIFGLTGSVELPFKRVKEVVNS